MSDTVAVAAPSPAKVAKSPAKKVAAKKPKKASAHPKFSVMAVEAIAALKERGGSSLPAIKKWIDAKYHKDLPKGWEKFLNVSLKHQVAAGKLVKVKVGFST
jgi:histone H1/5